MGSNGIESSCVASRVPSDGCGSGGPAVVSSRRPEMMAAAGEWRSESLLVRLGWRLNERPGCSLRAASGAANFLAELGGGRVC